MTLLSKLLTSSLLLLVVQKVYSQTTNPKINDPDEVIRFNFRFGFFEDELTPLTEVIKEDVEGVICQTQYFLSQLTQNATGTKSVHAKATEIDWGYYQGSEMPSHINFTVEFEDPTVDGDTNWIDDQILINEMEKLGQPGLQKFITDWVWKAEPEGLNFFLNANKMAFDGVMQKRIEGTLDEAECPATIAPTSAPTTSPMPTNILGDVGQPGAGAGGPNGTDPNAPGVGAGGPNGTDPNGAGAGNGSNNPNGGQNPNNRPLHGNSGAAILPNASRPDWPFGPNYLSLDDLDPMADFSLSFNMFADHEKAPAESEVNTMLCELNEFFTLELRKKLRNGTLFSKAVFIDWYFNEDGGASGNEDIIVNFTAFAYYVDAKHTQVPATDVLRVFNLNPAELKNMIEQYVWMAEPEGQNLFAHTQQVFINGGTGAPLTDKNNASMMVEATGCIMPPSDPGAFAADPNDPNGDGGAGAGGGDPNDPNNPNKGVGGDGGASGGGAGDTPTGEELGLGGDAKGTQIHVAFRVSNLEDIKEPIAVKASGLDASFPNFANEMVSEMAKREAATRRLQTTKDGRVRVLRVAAVPGTAEVTSVLEYPCPTTALPGLTCHSASAKYDVLMSSDEDQAQVQNDYTEASQRAVDDGTYNNVLQKIDPDTPLYIGIMTSTDQIPPGSRNRGYDGEPEDDEGWFKWWYLLILLLLLLCCCLLCLYCNTAKNKEDPDPVVKESVVEEREVLVEEFDDEDRPDDHGAPADEEFVDDPDAPKQDARAAAAPPPGDDGVMVPYGQGPNKAGPPPQAGVLVPYDPDAKAHEDQAQREAILNNRSQRGGGVADDDAEWQDDDDEDDKDK